MPRFAALLAASVAALLPAGTRADHTPATSDGSAPGWRAMFVGVSPGGIELWSVALDGGDRRFLLTQPAFGDRFSDWYSRIDAHTPVVRSAVSGDGRWVALLLDASPGREASLWLANVETRALRLAATNVETFQWADEGARILYSIAPPPPSPMDELQAVQDGREWRLHEADSAADRPVAGVERKFYSAGPWSDPRRLLFWRVGLGFEQLLRFDAERGTVRDGRSLLHTNVRQFDRRPGRAWTLVPSDIWAPRCLEAWDVDRDGRFVSSLLRGCSYVCALGATCLAWRDADHVVVARSHAPPLLEREFEWWWSDHPVSLVERDLRSKRERVLLDGRPDAHWRMLGSRPGEILIVSRSTVDRPLAHGHRLQVEIQARDFDGRLLGALFRGENPPAFVGLVR